MLIAPVGNAHAVGMHMQYEKVCVEVLARFKKEGGIRPVALLWEDRRYEIERVKAVGRAPARVSSVLPVRFTCMVGGKERYLYLEPDRMRWFVEVAHESEPVHSAQRPQ